MAKEYVLPVGVRDELLRYLATRPFGEVEEGVQALRMLPELRAPGAPQPPTNDAPAERPATTEAKAGDDVSVTVGSGNDAGDTGHKTGPNRAARRRESRKARAAA